MAMILMKKRNQWRKLISINVYGNDEKQYSMAAY